MKTARQAARDASHLWRLCQVNGALDEALARFIVERAIESGGSARMSVLKRFMRLVKIDRARRAARVESAAPLGPQEQAVLEQALTRTYGRDLATTFVVDPALIAGVRVQVGDDVYDGSVKAGLAALEARF